MMKKLIGIFVFALMGAGAFAQNEKSATPDQRSNRISGVVIAQLDLTETQKEQVKAINADYRTKMQVVIKSDFTPEQRKAKRSELELDKRNRIIAILSPEQVKKLNALEGNGDYKEKTKTGSQKVKLKIKND